MPFFKRDGDDLLQAHCGVCSPEYTLTEETHADHSYPVDGWRWFASLDDAMAAMQSPSETQEVTAVQGLLALHSLGDGVVAAFNAWRASLDPVDDFETIAFFEHATTWKRDNPALIAAAKALGITDAQVDSLFILAATL